MWCSSEDCINAVTYDICFPKNGSRRRFASLFTCLLPNLDSPGVFRGFLCLDLLAAVGMFALSFFKCPALTRPPGFMKERRALKNRRMRFSCRQLTQGCPGTSNYGGKYKSWMQKHLQTLPKTLSKFLACTPLQSSMFSSMLTHRIGRPAGPSKKPLTAPAWGKL